MHIDYYILHKHWCDYLEQQRKHPYTATGGYFSPEEQINLRNFSQKRMTYLPKLIVKLQITTKRLNLWQKNLKSFDRTMEIPYQFIVPPS